MTIEVSGQEVQQQEKPKEAKPQESKQFCPCCRKVARFIIEGCLRICQTCGSIGQADK